MKSNQKKDHQSINIACPKFGVSWPIVSGDCETQKWINGDGMARLYLTTNVSGVRSSPGGKRDLLRQSVVCAESKFVTPSRWCQQV